MPFVFFLVYILIEIALFIWIGSIIGIGWTLLWVLGGFVVGVLMLKKGGEQSRKWLQAASAGGPRDNPSKQIYWYIGGLLVILPGFFTDFIGLALVFPPTQAIVTSILSSFVPASLQTGFTVVSNFNSSRAQNGSDVIEGEVVEVPDPEISDQGPRES